MLLTVPPFEIGPTDGFEPSLDIFHHKAFGERVANLVASSPSGAVFALDAAWGEGKTTFIRMWSGFAERHRRLKVIYFDAFANDYQRDPFLALSAEIYELLDSDDKRKQEEFRRKVTSVGAALARGAIRIGVGAVTGGVLSATSLEDSKQAVSDLFADQVDAVVATRLQSHRADKSAIVDLREFLTEAIASLEDVEQVVFVIDELDRCRPDFALELLEKIKHLFSDSGLVFLLVVNRKQLEASVKARYGSELDAAQYLEKFVHIWLELPRADTKRFSTQETSEVYFTYCVYRMTEPGETIASTESLETMRHLAIHHKLPLRTIERALSNFAAIYNASGGANILAAYQIALGFMCVLKAMSPAAFQEFSTGRPSPEDALRSAGLLDIPEEIESYYLRTLAKLIRYEFSDAGNRERVKKDDAHLNELEGFWREDVIWTAVRWLREVEPS